MMHSAFLVVGSVMGQLWGIMFFVGALVVLSKFLPKKKRRFVKKVKVASPEQQRPIRSRRPKRSRGYSKEVVVPSLEAERLGAMGEKAVDSVLMTGLNASVYHRFSNVMLPVDGATTQIDQVVVSRFGVFVIETKNMTGWIFGNMYDAQWTQALFRKKSRFQNPLRQNYRHTQVLGELTGIPKEYFQSVVVFLPGADFKTELPPNVLRTHDVVDYIHSFQKPIIKDEQVPEVVSAIGEWAGTVDEATRSNHVANLRKRHGG